MNGAPFKVLKSIYYKRWIKFVISIMEKQLLLYKKQP